MLHLLFVPQSALFKVVQLCFFVVSINYCGYHVPAVITFLWKAEGRFLGKIPSLCVGVNDPLPNIISTVQVRGVVKVFEASRPTKDS